MILIENIKFSHGNFVNFDVVLVNEYEIARELAWSQDLDVVENVWEDIKLLESGDVIGKLYEGDLNSIEKPIRQFIQSLGNYPDTFVSKYIDIFEEITGDLLVCALNRLVNGKTDNLYEKIFEAYKLGGWPCGWEGEYPQGRMIVFSPNPERIGVNQ